MWVALPSSYNLNVLTFPCPDILCQTKMAEPRTRVGNWPHELDQTPAPSHATDRGFVSPQPVQHCIGIVRRIACQRYSARSATHTSSLPFRQRRKGIGDATLEYFYVRIPPLLSQTCLVERAMVRCTYRLPAHNDQSLILEPHLRS